MIDLIVPYKIDSPKLRLGTKRDGGYVISAVSAEQSACLFSYGVGHDFSFDCEYSRKYNKLVYMFDPTMDSLPITDEKLLFFKEGLGIRRRRCKDFLRHYKQFKIMGNVLLKIDIEGGEYEYLTNCDINEISRKVSGIVVEFHRLDKRNANAKFVEIMKRLNQFYLVTHIHGNNYRDCFDCEFESNIYKVPRTLEMTFVNKRLVSSYEPDMEKYPIKGLDYPNYEPRGEIRLKFVQQYYARRTRQTTL